MSGEQPAPEPSRIQTEQALRQMNDEWVKALVRADAATLDRIWPTIFSLLIRWRVMISHSSSAMSLG